MFPEGLPPGFHKGHERSIGSASYAHPSETLRHSGGDPLRNCRHVRGLLRGPTKQRPTHIQTTRSRGPMGGCHLRNSRRSHGVLGCPAWRCVTYIQKTPRSSLGGASTCATVATFKGSWEAQRSSVLCTRIRNIASPRGAATCAVVASFVDSWEVQRDLAAPWRAATCATVAAILRSWEVQQGGV